MEIVKDENENPDNLYYVQYYKKEQVKNYRKAERASIVGDTVGDPLKDTSGPSLNILVKLSSIVSVIFGHVFVQTGVAFGVGTGASS